MDKTLKLMIARFPYGGTECSETVDWLMQTVLDAEDHPLIGEVIHFKINDTPITMGRNRCLAEAKAAGCDLVLMIDSDMAPDLYVGVEPDAKPFFNLAVDFLAKHDGPAIIAAPYCGPPPHECVYIFTWRDRQGDTPDGHGTSLEMYTREHAASLGGVQEAAALATGLMLIDMRAIDKLPPPYFYYEFDQDETRKLSTEDVTFSRDLSLAGVPMYCAWDSWAGHRKTKVVGKPRPPRPDEVAERMKPAILSRAPRTGEKLYQMGVGKPA